MLEVGASLLWRRSEDRLLTPKSDRQKKGLHPPAGALPWSFTLFITLISNTSVMVKNL